MSRSATLPADTVGFVHPRTGYPPYDGHCFPAHLARQGPTIHHIYGNVEIDRANSEGVKGVSIIRAAPVQAGPKPKIRIKRNNKSNAPASQPPQDIPKALHLASTWAASVDKRLFENIIPDPKHWPSFTLSVAQALPKQTSPPTVIGNMVGLNSRHARAASNLPAAPDRGTKHILPSEPVPEALSSDGAAAATQPAAKRRKKCSSDDGVHATQSLDQQQISALQNLNSKLREQCSAAEESKSALRSQIEAEEGRRREADARATDLEAQLAELRGRVDGAEAKLRSQGLALAESEALRMAMEFRVGIQNPSAMLSCRDEFHQQAATAKRLWGQFEASSVDCAAAVASPAAFDTVAHAIVKGLQASVLLIHAGAHQFQHGAESVSHRRADITQGRIRIKEAQQWLKNIGGQVSGLSAANAAVDADLADKETARRSIFVQGASVLQKRLHTLSEIEYLGFERMSIAQTTKHANSKQLEYSSMRDLLKQRSPESDTSTAEVLGGGNGNGGALSAHQAQVLLDLANDFNAARKRLEATAELATGITKEAPRLQADLLRYFKSCESVRDGELAAKGRAIAWTMSAIAGEFGTSFNANVGTLQRACELLKHVLGRGRA